MPRDGILHATVSMRANDAMKLVPYNAFEFSLIHECMAARTGLQLGHYWHTAVSMHIRGDNIVRMPLLVEEVITSHDMAVIPLFSETIRSQIVQEETLIRSARVRSKRATLERVHRFWREYPTVWADILSTIACEAYRARKPHAHKSVQEMVEEFLVSGETNAVLLRAYRNFLDQVPTSTSV